MIALLFAATLASSAPQCEGLKALAIPNATITAEMVAAGPFTPPAFGAPPGVPARAGGPPPPAPAGDGRG